MLEDKMESFIKKIFIRKEDEQTHRQFVRFGKGTFAGRSALFLQKGEKVKFRGSFEWASDFVNLVSEIGDCKFSGVILSKENLGFPGKQKSGVYVSNVENISSDKIKEISGKAYTMLLDAEGFGISLKMKKKLPKPGKSNEAKVDDKFCQLEADGKHWEKIREAFLWDIKDAKKVRVVHTYVINEIVMPKGEKDFVKIRLMSKRKGKLIRKLEIDGVENVKEMEIEV